MFGSISIVCMMTVRMGLEPILSVNRSVSIDTMMKFDGDIDGHGDGICKQAFTVETLCLTDEGDGQQVV